MITEERVREIALEVYLEQSNKERQFILESAKLAKELGRVPTREEFRKLRDKIFGNLDQP